MRHESFSAFQQPRILPLNQTHLFSLIKPLYQEGRAERRSRKLALTCSWVQRCSTCCSSSLAARAAVRSPCSWSALLCTSLRFSIACGCKGVDRCEGFEASASPRKLVKSHPPCFNVSSKVEWQRVVQSHKLWLQRFDMQRSKVLISIR